MGERGNTMCFACGIDNPIGLKLDFIRDHDGDGGYIEFLPQQIHQGWAGILHGGLVSTCLDEVMAYAIYSQAVEAMTARMEIRFKKAIPVGEAVRFESRVKNRRKRLVDVEGRAVLADGTIAATAAATFMILSD